MLACTRNSCTHRFHVACVIWLLYPPAPWSCVVRQRGILELPCTCISCVQVVIFITYTFFLTSVKPHKFNRWLIYWDSWCIDPMVTPHWVFVWYLKYENIIWLGWSCFITDMLIILAFIVAVVFHTYLTCTMLSHVAKESKPILLCMWNKIMFWNPRLFIYFCDASLYFCYFQMTTGQS